MSNELQTQKQEIETSNGAERTRSMRLYLPPVDIYSAEDGIVILADMPGVDERNVDITVEKNVLTISGFVTTDVPAPEGYELTYHEYGIGDFQRSFTLSDEVDSNGIEASLSKGVLRLDLPKAPEAKARKISVTAR